MDSFRYLTHTPEPHSDVARSIANDFLTSQRQTTPGSWKNVEIGSSIGAAPISWRGSPYTLYDVPLIDASTNSAAGYILVSVSAVLPKVLEYATSGSSLVNQLEETLRPFLIRLGLPLALNRYVFVTSTEIYADIGSGLCIVLPDLAVRNLDYLLSRMEAATGGNLIVRQSAPVMTGSNEIILYNNVPIQYQQNCESYPIDSAIGGDNYCAPKAIAGCVAVGWAMWLSAWKRSPRVPEAPKIWPNSKCWAYSWRSKGPPINPNICEDVNRTIWQLHSLCGTSPDGVTSVANVLNGSHILAEFGINWRICSAESPSYELATSVIDAGQPFLWIAQGVWNQMHPAVVGHAVVVYGYRKAERMLRVALGWGKFFEDRNVNFDQFANSSIYYKGE